MQKEMLEKAGKNTAEIDRQIGVQERAILRARTLIKKLG
jgi:hypothetical protein